MHRLLRAQRRGRPPAGGPNAISTTRRASPSPPLTAVSVSSGGGGGCDGADAASEAAGGDTHATAAEAAVATAADAEDWRATTVILQPARPVRPPPVTTLHRRVRQGAPPRALAVRVRRRHDGDGGGEKGRRAGRLLVGIVVRRE